MDGMNNGVLPGCEKLTGCKTGVENEDKNVADGMETKLEEPDADTVSLSEPVAEEFFIE